MIKVFKTSMKIFILIAVVVFTSSCTSMIERSSYDDNYEENPTFMGTARCSEIISQGPHVHLPAPINYVVLVGFVIDWPLSLVTDLISLPYDLNYEQQRNNPESVRGN